MVCNSMGTVGWLMMGGLWLAVIAVVLWGVTAAARSPGGFARSGVDARAVLDDRLARGEIDTEEYRGLRSTLEDAR
jgi:putative membrane protein